MITEIARLSVDPAQAAAFEQAVAACAPLFRAAAGCRSMRLAAEVETPGHYTLQVDWETLDDHVVGFRQSPAFGEWRSAVGPFFLAAPAVTHERPVACHF